MAQGGRNESNSNVLPAIGEKKIFHQLDVHQVFKVGIKRFWAQEAKVSLTAMSLLESARRKCLESRIHTFLGAGGRNESKSDELPRIGEKKSFHEFDVHQA